MPWVAGSATASQTLPSSSSASPMMAMNLDASRSPKCESTYRRTTPAKRGAAAPNPTYPVEKSTPVWVLRARRIGQEATKRSELGR
jgi:hypothetical protein